MNKIGPGIAKIQRKTSSKHFCLSISAVMYRTYERQLSRAIKQIYISVPEYCTYIDNHENRKAANSKIGLRKDKLRKDE